MNAHAHTQLIHDDLYHTKFLIIHYIQHQVPSILSSLHEYRVLLCDTLFERSTDSKEKGNKNYTISILHLQLLSCANPKSIHIHKKFWLVFGVTFAAQIQNYSAIS